MIYRERITTRQAFLCLNTPRTTILQIWCTHFAMYLPQFISPHRRQIHGLFVDLQAKAERQNQDSQHLMKHRLMVKPKDQNREKGRPSRLKRTRTSPLCCFLSAYLLYKLRTDFHGLPHVCALHKTQNAGETVSKITTTRSNSLRIPPLPGANAIHSSCAVSLFARW